MACSVAQLLGVAWGSRLQVIGQDGAGHLVPLDEDVLNAGLGDSLPETGTTILPSALLHAIRLQLIRQDSGERDVRCLIALRMAGHCLCPQQPKPTTVNW